MTQSLSNLMTSPLALVALFLWLLLALLALRQCRAWAKASQKERIIEKNHPAIPVKKYDLSEIEQASIPEITPLKATLHSKVSAQEQAHRLAFLQKAWDT